MDNTKKFYIGGQWVLPNGQETLQVLNPATEQPIAEIAMGTEHDVNLAVASAQKAFQSFSRTSVKERIELLEQVVAQYQRRLDDIAAACCSEMGAPIGLAKAAQSPAGLGHFMATLEALRSYQFEEIIDATTVAYEPVGVCGLITPWNWPLNQIAAKVAPALATGCTMVLKPSELAPLNAIIVAEVLHEAGVPAGVFNLINGDGAVVGAALAKHPGVDMVSFTGSTRAGIEVAKNAAVTVKRVTQELGGKSANIVLDDADLAEVISRDMQGMCVNTGQSCNAGSRFLVPKEKMHQAAAFAKTAAESVVVGDPETDGTAMGPLVSQLQYDKVQRLIEQAIDEGANLVCGGLGRPAGLNVGYYVQPTVFSDVTNDMTIAREEIFGPVITLIGYDSEENAIDIANDTVYGLSGYVSSPDQTRASRVARRLRTGMVHINGAGLDNRAPFGGYKQSGNGREFAGHGIRDFLEAKSIFGDNSGRN
jgi:aldehyde dehydrogenase (NAD+)